LLAGAAASFPAVASLATSFTFTNVTLAELATNAPTLVAPGVAGFSVGASTSRSAKAAPFVRPVTVSVGPAAAPVRVALLPVYDHAVPAPPGQVTPPKTWRPTSWAAPESAMDSVYALAQTTTRWAVVASARERPCAIVATGAAIVPALESLPDGATKTAVASVMGHDLADGGFDGSQAAEGEAESASEASVVPASEVGGASVVLASGARLLALARVVHLRAEDAARADSGERAAGEKAPRQRSKGHVASFRRRVKRT
jgi:hypothetical protein